MGPDLTGGWYDAGDHVNSTCPISPPALSHFPILECTEFSGQQTLLSHLNERDEYSGFYLEVDLEDTYEGTKEFELEIEEKKIRKAGKQESRKARKM